MEAYTWAASIGIAGCEDGHPKGWPLLFLSLSRLNHRLPRAQTDPEVMQGTAEFHHDIADALLPQPEPVFNDTTPLDAPVDMLKPQPTVVQGLVRQLLLHGQLLAARVSSSA